MWSWLTLELPPSLEPKAAFAMRILIAEDDLTSRTMLAEILRRHHHEVVEAAEGAAALALLQAPAAPALAILDWMMPKLDGLEVVRQVRAQPAKQPPYLIMLTSKGEKANIIHGLGSGANDYIAKPFDAAELLARIDVGRRMVELQAELVARNEELHLALAQIKTLRGIVPICATCKKIRDDRGFWDRLEAFIGKHTEATFSHGICPECEQKALQELDAQFPERP